MLILRTFMDTEGNQDVFWEDGLADTRDWMILKEIENNLSRKMLLKNLQMEPIYKEDEFQNILSHNSISAWEDILSIEKMFIANICIDTTFEVDEFLVICIWSNIDEI